MAEPASAQLRRPLRRCSHAVATWQCGRWIRHESGICRAHRGVPRLARIAAAERRVVEAAEAWEQARADAVAGRGTYFDEADALAKAVRDLRAAREAK